MNNPKKLKAYVADNLDGTRTAMVAASTMKEAAKAMRTTEGQMRSYGWHVEEGDAAALALAEPGVVFFKSLKIPSTDEWAPRTPRAVD